MYEGKVLMDNVVSVLKPMYLILYLIFQTTPEKRALIALKINLSFYKMIKNNLMNLLE